VFEAAEELGLHIPDDLSVVGFDNISEAKYLGLTTINQFLEEMGYVAVQMLIKLIGGVSLELEVHKMQTKLIERSSCCRILQPV
jgi:LacI family transcriptional regulator